MKQRQLFDKNPDLFNFTKTMIPATGQTIPSSRLNGRLKFPMSDSENKDIFKNMKPLIILGRIIFMIPCSKRNYSTYKQMKIR